MSPARGRRGRSPRRTRGGGGGGGAGARGPGSAAKDSVLLFGTRRAASCRPGRPSPGAARGRPAGPKPAVPSAACSSPRLEVRLSQPLRTCFWKESRAFSRRFLPLLRTGGQTGNRPYTPARAGAAPEPTALAPRGLVTCTLTGVPCPPPSGFISKEHLCFEERSWHGSPSSCANSRPFPLLFTGLELTSSGHYMPLCGPAEGRGEGWAGLSQVWAELCSEADVLCTRVRHWQQAAPGEGVTVAPSAGARPLGR